VTVELPDSPPGRAARVVLDVLGGAPHELLEPRLDDAMRAVLTPETVASVRDELGAFEVTRVGHHSKVHVVVRLAAAAGDVVMSVFVHPEPPHAIAAAVVDHTPPGERWQPIDGDSVLHRAHRELELASIAGAVVAGDSTWLGAVGDVDEHSRFSIGSITKTMTAALVQQLVHEGLVSMDDPVDDLVPDVEVPEGVTVGLVVDHRSGLVTDAALEGEPDIVGLYSKHPLRCAFEPGSQRAYSNAGYGLLGHLVATVRGTSYGEALRRGVFDPAGMVESDLDGRRAIPGFCSWAGTLSPVEWEDVAIPGAGAVISTAADMARYVRAVLDGAMPRVGWVQEGALAWHNGGWDGFCAMAFLDPCRRRGSVLLTNTGRVTGQGLLEAFASPLLAEVCGVD
jgi:CubicO group peptidase (beta-lactamase class C family)